MEVQANCRFRKWEQAWDEGIHSQSKVTKTRLLKGGIRRHLLAAFRSFLLSYQPFSFKYQQLQWRTHTLSLSLSPSLSLWVWNRERERRREWNGESKLYFNSVEFSFFPHLSSAKSRFKLDVKIVQESTKTIC